MLSLKKKKESPGQNLQNISMSVVWVSSLALVPHWRYQPIYNWLLLGHIHMTTSIPLMRHCYAWVEARNVAPDPQDSTVLKQEACHGNRTSSVHSAMEYISHCLVWMARSNRNKSSLHLYNAESKHVKAAHLLSLRRGTGHKDVSS